MRLRGINLLAAVFGELQDLVPEGSISTEELLTAAQSLIELSKNEYITKADRDPSLSSGYFSHDLTVAFEKYQMSILRNEHKIQHDDDLSHEGKMRLKTTMVGTKIDMHLEVFDA